MASPSSVIIHVSSEQEYQLQRASSLRHVFILYGQALAMNEQTRADTAKRSFSASHQLSLDHKTTLSVQVALRYPLLLSRFRELDHD